MKKYFKILVPVVMVFFSVSTVSAQFFPGRDRDNNRYEDRRYENSRYENGRYGNSYGSGWFDLGRVRASRTDNYDRINLNSRQSNVRQLLFRSDGLVNIYRVALRYNNGRTEELRVRDNRYDRRGSSYNNDLIVTVPNRGYSDVRQVMVWYDVNNYSRFRPTINVYGR